MPLVTFARLAANKSIASATDTLLSGGDLTAVGEGTLASALSSSALTIPWSDWWRVQFHGAFAAANTGARAAKILRNSTVVSTGSVGSDVRVSPGTVGEGTFDVVPLPMYLVAGDVLRFAVWQNSGAALNLVTAIFGGSLTGVSLECVGTAGVTT